MRLTDQKFISIFFILCVFIGCKGKQGEPGEPGKQGETGQNSAPGSLTANISGAGACTGDVLTINVTNATPYPLAQVVVNSTGSAAFWDTFCFGSGAAGRCNISVLSDFSSCSGLTPPGICYVPIGASTIQLHCAGTCAAQDYACFLIGGVANTNAQYSILFNGNT